LLLSKRFALKIADSGFFSAVRSSRKILIIVFGGLGDVVHSVPALRSIRLSFPKARIDVLAPASAAPLLRELEGVDRVIPHRGKQAGWSFENLRQYWALFGRRYDLCIDLWGSNHSSGIAWCSGARVRLGRRPLEIWKRAWRWCHTHIAVYPYQKEAMHTQWTAMLAELGFAVDRRFALRLGAARLASVGIDPALQGRYIHLSPSTGDPARDLPVPVLAEMLNGIGRRLPRFPQVLSTTAAPRDCERLTRLLALLERPPLKVFAGELDTAGLYALIQGAALSLSADSAPVHIAVAADTPSVSWFLQNPGIREYLPPAPRHRALIATEPRGDGICTIAARQLIELAIEALGEDSAPREVAG